VDQVALDGGLERVLDPPSQPVDGLSELRDGFQRAGLAPAGNVRDALAVDGEADC
jgi:hypothetical protein